MSLRSSYNSLLDRTRKSSPIRTEPKILCRTFLSNTLKAAASVLNGSMPLRTREVSATLLPIETILAPIGKGDPAFDLRTDNICYRP